MTLQQSFFYTLSIDGYGDTQRWDNGTGGDFLATSSRYAPGGSQATEAVATRPEPTDITLTREFRIGRDDQLQPAFDNLVGARCTVVRIAVDRFGNVMGRSRGKSGVFLGSTEPTVDTTSGDRSTWTVQIGTDGVPS